MRYLWLIAFAGLLCAQGTEPKAKPDDYEAHGQAKNAAIGAEFTVHSFSRGEESFLATDYLVVEVALYPPKGETINVQNANFSLRINGRKQTLETASPSMVVASMQHPEWEQPGGIRPQVSAGVGNAGVNIGGPPYNSNPFPGSQQPGTRQPPIQPRDDPDGIRKPAVNAQQLLLETALVEGPHHAALSGFLYFPYRGKITAIKTLELLYEDAVLKLR